MTDFNGLYKLFFLVLLLSPNSGLKLDPDGGYHVFVGLEGTDEPEDTVAFLDTIQTDMEAFSDLMFSSTERKFHLKSVTVVIPAHWGHVGEEVAEGETLSDLKLREGIQVPLVRRSTQCGQPGSQILLPTNFFSPVNQSPRDRSLLHFWAQYRWGMFEESGFPYNTRFPAFVQREELGDWGANACTDKTLAGTVQFPNGTSCPIDEEDPPTTECRFIPEDPQPEVVHSSLLTHFHHLMDSFCTSETHQATLPTPHNVFCRGQSAWDVLLGSDDFKRVTQPAPVTRPPVTFTTAKVTTLPLIHFIFDARIIHQMPEDPFARIKTSLRAMFDVGSGVAEGLAAVTIFPGEDGQLTQQIVPWTKVAGSANDFRLSIDKISTLGITHAHFGLALRLVSEDIRARRHPTGSFVFIFKGSTGSNFDEMPFEDEVLSSLLAHKVQVHAVEVSHGPLDPGTNLVRLTEISGGSHFTLTSVNIGAQFDTFLRNFIMATKSPEFVEPSMFPLAAMVGTEVKLAVGHSSPVRLRLTTPLEMGQVEVVGPTGGVVPINETTQEWNEGKAQGRRRSLSVIIPSEEAVKGSVWRINCVEDRVTNCTGFFAVYQTIFAEQSPPLNKNLEEISLSVTAHFDEHLTGLLYIYASLEEGGESLVRLDSVGEYDAIASICLQTRPDDCWTIRLRDDGAGTPDLLADDGVMSGASLPPPLDAVYQVRVALSYRYNFPPPRGKEVAEEAAVFPCAFTPQAPIELCVGRYPPDSFQIVSAYPHPLEIHAASTTPPQSKPSRTFDLSLISLPGGGLTLAWTAPSVFLPGNVIGSADAYDLRFCTSWDSLVDDFDGCIRIEIGTIPATPGVKEQVTITEGYPSQPIFLGLKSKFEEAESELSNVAWGQPSQDEGSSTTETVSESLPSSTESEGTTEMSSSTTTEPPTTQETTSPTPIESTATSQPTTEETIQTTEESTTEETTTNEATTSTDDSTTPTSDEPTTDDSTTPTSDESTTGESTTPTSEESTTVESITPTSDESTTDDSTTPTSEESTTDDSTTPTSEESTTGESTTPTSEESTTGDPTTPTSEEPTTDDSTTPTSEEPTTGDSTMPTSDEPTTDDSTTSEDPSTDDSTTPEPTTQESSRTSTPSTTILYTTPPPVTTEKPEYFFKTTVGYVTAGAIALVCVGGLGAAIGLLFWKRRALSLALAARSANHHNI